MSNQLQMVTKKQALKLKQLGFDWVCTSLYGKDKQVCPSMAPENYNNYISPYLINSISAPEIAVALKWLRDKKKIHVNLWTEDNDAEWRFNLEFHDGSDHKDDATTELIIYPSFEDAESAGLTFALNYLTK